MFHMNINMERFPVKPLGYDVQIEEDWTDSNTPAYNPTEVAKANPVFRQLNVESARKRRDFRYEERLRISALEEANKVGDTSIFQ